MSQPISLVLCVLLCAVLVVNFSRYRTRTNKLDAIPTVGHRNFFASYISAYKFIKNASIIVQEGYKRYPNSVFKVPLLDRWLVLISGPGMIEDLRKATEDELSLRASFQETFHSDLIFGISGSSYHTDVLRVTFTRNIGTKAPEVYDEIVAAFDDEIPQTNGWTKVPTLQVVLNIVCRSSNRAFVGLPLCRNEEWKALNIGYARSVINAIQIINLFPRFLQPIITRLLNPRKVACAAASTHLRPVILDRLKRLSVRSEEWEVPEDLLMWFIKTAETRKASLDPEDLINRLLVTNLAAIHTTSMAFTHALFNLASRPELIELLREEAESIIQEEGWTKAAMAKMQIMDSFLIESQRVSSSPPTGVSRVALRDFTFSNGTVVPAGTLIMACTQAIHFDESNYPNPSQFDALRFYKSRKQQGESSKYRMANPEVNYLTFGVGKQACPGRFFAVHQLKFLLSYTLLYYDIKYDEEDEEPKPSVFGGRVNLDAKTKMMFRKRGTPNM